MLPLNRQLMYKTVYYIEEHFCLEEIEVKNWLKFKRLIIVKYAKGWYTCKWLKKCLLLKLIEVFAEADG